MNRRIFLMAGGAALAGARTAAPAKTKLKVSVFSKHLQFLKGEELAETAASLGFDGVDLTVRPGGHIEPARVQAELPPLVKILRSRGQDVQMVTSGIVDTDTPHAESVIRTLAELGIRYYRWGGLLYEPDRPIPAQLDALKPRIAKLAALNEKYKVCAMYHTHSGLGQVGASIWDLYILLKDFNPDAVSVNYDTAHATVEGGYGGWINSLRVTETHLRGVAVKDFRWEKDSKGTWTPQWCPVGEGMVRFPQFFRMIAERKFAGPLQMHYEYPLGGADTGKTTITIPREKLYTAMKRDLRLVRGWLAEVGL
jgi:sugar phosphate isomerase/epimerase